MSLGDTYDDLDAALTAPTEAAAQSPGFTIDNLERADWAARKIARARRELAQAELVAAAERQRLDDYIDNERLRCQNDTDYLCGLLEGFHRRLLDADPKRKTITLPGGASLVARKSPDSLVVEDEEAATEFAREFCPEAVVVTTRLDKPTLKRALALVQDFDIPGVRFQTGETTYRVKTDAEVDA